MSKPKEKQSTDGSLFSARRLHSLTIASIAVALAFGAVCVINLAQNIGKAAEETSVGLRLLESGKAEQGISHLESAKALDKNAIKNLKKDGETPEETVAQLSKALLLFPDNARLLVDRANAYVELKRFDEAQKDYQRAINLDLGRYSQYSCGYSGFSSDLIPSYADFLLKHGKKEVAVAFLERSLGVVTADKETADEIVSISKKLKIAHRILPRDPETWQEIWCSNVLGSASSAIDSDDEDKRKEAIKSLDEFLAKHPRSGPVMLVRAQINVSEFPDKAIEDTNRMLSVYPGQAEALLIRSEAYSQKHDFQAALRDVDQALKQLPESVELLKARSDLLLRNGNWQAALADLDKTSSHDPEIISRRADIFESVGDREKAAEELRRQILWQRFADLGDENAISYYWTSDLFSRQCQLLLATGKITDAEKIVDEKLKEAKLENEYYRHRLTVSVNLVKSQISLLQGDKEKALYYANEACLSEEKQGEFLIESLLQRATVYDAMLRSDLARADLQRALTNLREKGKDDGFDSSDYIESALLKSRLGDSKTVILSDLKEAVKKGASTVDLARFVFELKDLKRSQLAEDVINQIKHDRPELSEIAKKWI